MKTIRQIAAAGALWFVVYAVMSTEVNAAREGRSSSPARSQSAPAAQAAPRASERSSGQRGSEAQSARPQQTGRSAEHTISAPASASRASERAAVNRSEPVVSSATQTQIMPSVSSNRSSTVSNNRSQTRSAVTQNRTVEAASTKTSYQPQAAVSSSAKASREVQTSSRSAAGVSPAAKTETVKTITPAPTKTAASSNRTETVTRADTKAAAVSNTITPKNDASGHKTARDSTQPSRATEAVRVDSSKITAKADRVTSKDISRADSGVATASIAEPKTAAVHRDRVTADRTKVGIEGTRTVTASVLPATSEKRARTAGTERVTAQPSVEYTNKRIITASETRVRTANYEPENISKLVVKGDNNVIIQGDVTVKRPRPYIAPRLYHHDIHYSHHDWHDHGTYFSFGWSSSSCGTVIWAPYCSDWGFSYYYPAYHRRYVFVSIGGYWPTCYRYRRYYWYGCHPHYWYGADIIQEPAVYNTYNTYNYYNTTAPAAAAAETNVYDNPPLAKTTEVVDEIDAPNDESVVDICFAHGVKVFGDGNYTEAIERFRRAVQMDPEDVILPFTYSQALFANGDYALAAGVLRGAVQNIPDDELTIYYPRGLYTDEKVLTDQIKRLELAIAGEPFVADYQLLLGYQYLGLGQLQQARGPLTEAAKDPANQLTAGKLMELADRLEAEQSKTGN
jgi:hypothetical protein